MSKPIASQLEKNFNIIRSEVYQQIDEWMTVLDSEIVNLPTGLKRLILSPLISLAYYSFGARDNIRKRLQGNADIVLNTALYIVKNKIDVNEVEKIIDENLDLYLSNDEVYHRLNKEHPLSGKACRILREVFKSRVLVTVIALRDGKGENYVELIRSAFDRDEIVSLVETQFKFAKQGIELVEKNDGLIQIPFINKNELLNFAMMQIKHFKKVSDLLIQEIFDER